MEIEYRIENKIPVTPCPHELVWYNYYIKKHDVIGVGSKACAKCQFYRGGNDKLVKCGKSIKEPIRVEAMGIAKKEDFEINKLKREIQIRNDIIKKLISINLNDAFIDHISIIDENITCKLKYVTGGREFIAVIPTMPLGGNSS